MTAARQFRFEQALAIAAWQIYVTDNKMNVSQLKQKLNNKRYRWFAATTVSVIMATVFALYNGYLGLFRHVIWSGSICIYYLFLACIKVVILFDVKRHGDYDDFFLQSRLYWRGSAKVRPMPSVKSMPKAYRALHCRGNFVGSDGQKQAVGKQKTVYVLLAVLVMLSSLVLVVPIALMVQNQKSVDFGLIPAITVATYTTYKVTMAIVNYKRNKRYQSVALRLMGTTNFIDAVLSVLTLQNTLITVQEGGVFGKMLTLATVSSAAGTLLIFVVSVLTLRYVLKYTHG